jgi:isopentenyl diphosphate isomerase/L-lactate dehydrogenase-like FMN-dependent dehydrogenase
VSLDGLERRAPPAMTREADAYAYVAGGSAAEETMRGNRAAFERVRIVPRMLRDVARASVDDLGPAAVELSR